MRLRLARILHRLLPDDSEVRGLLALLLLTHARRAARVDSSGELVSLEDQDRRRWDADRITEGRSHVVAALHTASPGPYTLRAAIAAEHDDATDVATTDWAEIVALYDLLLTVSPSPVVELNRAVAVAKRDGPEAGLAALEALNGATLSCYHLLPAARADVLRRLGRSTEAAQQYRAALDLVANERERTFLLRKLADLMT